MYRMNRQMRIEDFVFPYGQLDKNNEWVKLADLVPWDEAEEVYARQFVNNGHPAHPARIALGALIIKQRLKCSDEWTVRHVSENPYLQYFLRRLFFHSFSEATDFLSAVEGYRQEHGCYPQRIIVDKIYRNRETISWCKAQGIQLTGPALGRPAKDAERTKQAKKQEYQDICDRNIVEGEFGVGKRSYGLNRIMARLQETSFCVIGIALLCMNLAKRLRSLLHHFLQIWFLSAPSPVFTF